MNAMLIEKVDEAETRDIENAENDSPHVFPISTATIMFHLLMIFACLYYCMLLTNWGSANIDDSKTDFFENNSMSFWIKLIA